LFSASTDFDNSQRHVTSALLLEFEHFSRDTERSRFSYQKRKIKELQASFDRGKENLDENAIRGLITETRV
jgi:hypothetical protein